MGFQGTTICAVKRDGHCAIAGDGQVTLGENTIMKNSARKVRRVYNDKVVVGFAGSVADALPFARNSRSSLSSIPARWNARRWSLPSSGGRTR